LILCLNLYDSCTSIDETPKGENLEYVLSIESKKVPFKLIRNLYHVSFPYGSAERAFKKRDKIVKKYSLNNEDVTVSAIPFVRSLRQP
jgi:hypothetical protein